MPSKSILYTALMGFAALASAVPNHGRPDRSIVICSETADTCRALVHASIKGHPTTPMLTFQNLDQDRSIVWCPACREDPKCKTGPLIKHRGRCYGVGDPIGNIRATRPDFAAAPFNISAAPAVSITPTSSLPDSGPPSVPTPRPSVMHPMPGPVSATPSTLETRTDGTGPSILPYSSSSDQPNKPLPSLSYIVRQEAPKAASSSGLPKPTEISSLKDNLPVLPPFFRPYTPKSVADSRALEHTTDSVHLGEAMPTRPIISHDTDSGDADTLTSAPTGETPTRPIISHHTASEETAASKTPAPTQTLLEKRKMIVMDSSIHPLIFNSTARAKKKPFPLGSLPVMPPIYRRPIPGL